MLTDKEMGVLVGYIEREIGNRPEDAGRFETEVHEAELAWTYTRSAGEIGGVDQLTAMIEAAERLKAGINWLYPQTSLIMKVQDHVRQQSPGIHRPIVRELQSDQERLTELQHLLHVAQDHVSTLERGRPADDGRFVTVIYHLAKAWKAATGGDAGISTVKDGTTKGGPFLRFVEVALPIITHDQKKAISGGYVGRILKDLKDAGHLNSAK